MTEALRGPAGFETYYSALYAGRWADLRAALLGEGKNEEYSECLTRPYYLDPASIAVARALNVEPGHDVLDLCAAPGGKTLVIACALNGQGNLIANERSSARRARLHRVLDEHLSADLRATVKVTGHDASRWGLHEPESYDRVLADVPCSSERHVIQSESSLHQWSSSRPNRLAAGAYAIACAAVDSAKPGGTVVYSTCALTPGENDGVVSRLVRRSARDLRPQREMVHLESISPPDIVWEQTEHGFIALPDASSGMGPMYFAVLQK